MSAATMEKVLRPCGCRFGASTGFFESVIQGVRRCDCCGKDEEIIVLDRTQPAQRGRPKPRPDRVTVCADCLVDWKGIEKRDARK